MLQSRMQKKNLDCYFSLHFFVLCVIIHIIIFFFENNSSLWYFLYSPSSGESDDGRIICNPDERIMKEECRESETECDRICKKIIIVIHS